jgi:hypothetical protein
MTTLGKHWQWSDESKQRWSIQQKGKTMPTGEQSIAWKGDRVGYHGVHDWVKKNLPRPELCQWCRSKPPRDLANITGRYNRDFINWMYMCRSCHKRLDSIA